MGNLGKAGNGSENQHFPHSGLGLKNASFADSCEENYPFLETVGWEFFFELGAATYAIFSGASEGKK